MLGPSLANLQGAAWPCRERAVVKALLGSNSQSQLFEHQCSPPSYPAQPHTTHTHAHTHACSTAHELILPRLAAWVGSFLLELFVQLSFK